MARTNIDVLESLATDNLTPAVANLEYWMGQGGVQVGSVAAARRTAIVAAVANIGATDTLIINFPLVLAGAASTGLNGTLNPGTRVVIDLTGTCTSSNADSAVFTLRNGTAGTKADASFATATVTTAGSGSAIAFQATIDFTVRTIGASGTGAGSLTVNNTGVTGIAGVTNTVVPFTTSTLVTTTSTFLDLSLVTAATSVTQIQTAVCTVYP